MFDRIMIAPARDTHQYTTVTEHRAPTDESVRLLKEMEQAARDKVLQSVQVEDSTIACVLHTMRDVLSDKLNVVAIVKVNGKKMEIRREFDMYDMTREKVAIGMHTAVAERIAAELLSKAFAATVDKLGNFR